MPIWTVDTWRIRPEAESHFLQGCSALSPESLTLFRDLEKRHFVVGRQLLLGITSGLPVTRGRLRGAANPPRRASVPSHRP